MSEIVTQKVKELNPAQLKSIETLLTAGNISQAATAAGVSRNTLYRWMADDLFLAALHAAEAEAVAQLARRLAGLGEQAANVLADAMMPGQKIGVRLRAAEIVTANLLRLRELVTLEDRTLALEENARAKN